MNHYVMLQRNLIYTGITRAKKILVMVGTKKALSYAVRNVTVTKRNTLLKERLAGEIQVRKTAKVYYPDFVIVLPICRWWQRKELLME